MKIKSTFATMIVLCGALSASASNAAVITETFDVTATNFDYTTYGATPPVPIDPMLLSFTITYDPTVATTVATTTGVILNSVNVSYTLPLEYYQPIAGSALYVGTFSPGPSLDSGFDIGLYADNTLDYARYFAPGGVYADFGGYGTVTVTPGSPVPEPGTWTMTLFGFGSLGAVLRSRRRVRDVTA